MSRHDADDRPSTDPPCDADTQDRRLTESVPIIAAGAMVILSTVLLSPGLPRLVSHLESEGVPWVSADTFAKALVTAPAGVVAIFAVAGGWILDRIGRRPVLLAGLAVFGTCGVAGAFLSSPWALMASRIGVGFGLSGILLASTTLIGDYFDGSDRRRVLGWQIAVLSACSVVCLFMAAWLSQHSWRYPFGIYALSLCIVPWAWKQVDEPEEEEKLDDGDEDPEDRSASIAWSRISLIYVGSFLALAIFHLATTQMPGYLEELGYGSPYASAGLIAMMSLLAVPSSIGFDRVRNHLSDRSLLLIVFVFGGVGFAVAGFGTSLTFLLSGLAIFSLPYGFRTPALKSWLLDEAPGRHRRAVPEDHVVEQRSAVGHVDAERALHGPRGQADLPADDPRARPDLARHERRLHGVRVVEIHVRVREAQESRLHARAFGLEQRVGGRADLLRAQHGSSATPLTSAPIPSARTSISSPGTSQRGGSSRAPAPVGVPVTITSPGTSVVKVEM